MYYSTMQSNFELEKNQKAGTYTAIICAILLLLFYFITWRIEDVKPPVPEELIEVNLGNEKEGFGEVQPLIKGEMSPAQDPAPQPQQVAAAVKDEPAKDIEADESKDEDAAAVKKIEKNTSKKNEAPKENITKPVKVNNPAPVATPAPPKPQKPKFTYNGPGNGKGNGATEDNGYTSQGNDKNGKGDAGSSSGKPDSYGNSPGGKSGVSVVRGAKPLNLWNLKFQDDFNENAKVYVDIRYNSVGSFVSSTISKGTTTSNATILSIARRKVAELKFPPSEDGGVTTVLLNFKVQN